MRGLSLFDNPEALQQRGYVAYEVDQSTVPTELAIEQRGKFLDHFEIVPADQAFIAEEEFQALLNAIETLPPGRRVIWLHISVRG